MTIKLNNNSDAINSPLKADHQKKIKLSFTLRVRVFLSKINYFKELVIHI